MTWLTWRQFRAQTIATAGFLALCAVTLVVTGLSLAHLASITGLSGCHAAGCVIPADNFIIGVHGMFADHVIGLGTGVLYLAPAIIGIFWGAPLIAREIETGTFRLAWNQSVSRTRWMMAKLGLIGLAALATTGLLSLLTGWASSNWYRAAAVARGRDAPMVNRFEPILFGSQGIVPLGYAAFAFALGVTAGLLIRRTIPAMAVTLAGFAFVELGWLSWVRPHLMTPVRASVPFNVNGITGIMLGANNQMLVTTSVDKPGAWILANQTVRSSGRPFTGPATPACLGQGMQQCQASIARLHLRQLVTYQPGSRFWAFQWYETAIFVALAVALAGFCVWWLRNRRLT
ncbi:MAG TPA: ABC transporter permease [Streptosporangiaceae bacterium]